ncbi:hypothetical protein RUND412_009389, partial [Rhizina undulata]
RISGYTTVVTRGCGFFEFLAELPSGAGFQSKTSMQLRATEIIIMLDSREEEENQNKWPQRLDNCKESP